MLQISDPPTPRFRRFSAVGIFVSLLVHVGVVLAILVIAVQPWWFHAWKPGESRAILVTFGDRGEDLATDKTPVVRMVTDPDQVRGEMILEKIAEVATRAEQLDTQQKLDELDRLTNRFNQVASEQSIDRMAGQVHNLVGTNPRATQPAEDAIAGDFDFDTAQFHDVTRIATEGGGWRYVTIMLDAEGRTMEVELAAAEGEQLYLTMQRIKSNPLLEKVYRQIAMPLLDQMMAGIQQAATAGDALRQAAGERKPTEPTDGNELEEGANLGAGENPFADP